MTKIDYVYDTYDALFKEEQFERVDNQMEALTKTISTLSVDLILSMLTASFPAKSKLPNRKLFFDAAAEIFQPDILKGLE